MEEGLRRAAARLGLPEPRFVAETDSTNADLGALADAGAPHGTWIVADRQRAGRGRLGRSWEAPAGAAVLLSVLLRPSLRPRDVPLLCLATAVAVREACGPAYGIKWPNDVLAPDGRKVAGILAEMEGEVGRVRSVVIGVGVNVTAAPPLPTAACLAEVDGARDRAELAAAIVRGVLELTTSVEAGPGLVLTRWRAGSATLGRRVEVAGVRGVAEDIDADGALLVREAHGRLRRVLAGDVHMIA